MLLEADASPPSPDQPPAAPRTIARLVPHDPFFWVRMAAMAVYAVLYVIRFRTSGLIVDRISVAISVGIFLLCAFAGKPWRRWTILGVDAVLYASMWFCYEMTRGAADRIGFPLQLEAFRNTDRALFAGYDPNVWLQRHLYHADDVRWYDNVASVVYYTHFVFPAMALAIVWAISRVQWVRFMRRFASLLAVSCVMFVLIPTVPPWMASERYHRLAPIAPRSSAMTSRGFSDLGFHHFVKGWQKALDWGNAVAAMPSLHAAFALFVPAFFLPLIKPKWLKALVLVFPVMMLTSLVYLGEHWVIDGLVGWALVGASFWFWDWFETRQRRIRATRARQALGTAA
jgi:membrane-associated phospholipid phosphatase